MVADLVKSHEGWRAFIYCDACGEELTRDLSIGSLWNCSVFCKGGNLTIGYGTNLSDGLAEHEGADLLYSRLALAAGYLAGFPWFHKLNDARQAALIDMRYAMGGGTFRTFEK